MNQPTQSDGAQGAQSMGLQPVVLEGRYVRLEPLAPVHAMALAGLVQEELLWHNPYTFIPAPANINLFISSARDALEEGRELAFAIVDIASGTVVGSSRFRDIDLRHRRVEIGLTFIAPPWQRTYVNAESKYLMLRYAFEVWHCQRVQFMTDALNQRSCASLRRLGAKEEGLLRRHLVMPGGRTRDSVIFSVIDSEWPAMRASLEARMLAAWNVTHDATSGIASIADTASDAGDPARLA